jgi:hypothetical protein
MSGAVHLDDIINADNFHKIQDSMAEAADMAMLTVDFAGKPVTPTAAAAPSAPGCAYGGPVNSGYFDKFFKKLIG